MLALLITIMQLGWKNFLTGQKVKSLLKQSVNTFFINYETKKQEQKTEIHNSNQKQKGLHEC